MTPDMYALAAAALGVVIVARYFFWRWWVGVIVWLLIVAFFFPMTSKLLVFGLLLYATIGAAVLWLGWAVWNYGYSRHRETRKPAVEYSTFKTRWTDALKLATGVLILLVAVELYQIPGWLTAGIVVGMVLWTFFRLDPTPDPYPTRYRCLGCGQVTGPHECSVSRHPRT